MHKNRRITLHQTNGKEIKFNYITSTNTIKNVSEIQNVIIYVGAVFEAMSGLQGGRLDGRCAKLRMARF